MSIRIYSIDRNFEKSLHLICTLAARCLNAKCVHKNLLCFMEIIIFQLLSCLYLYDSGIPVPVRIRKQIRYTGFWPVALIYRAAGIPDSCGGVDILCRRYTDFWRPSEVCAKSVYRFWRPKGSADRYLPLTERRDCHAHNSPLMDILLSSLTNSFNFIIYNDFIDSFTLLS